MEKVYVVTQGTKELYFMAMNDPDDYDETIYEDTLVGSERVVEVFSDATAAVQYIVEKAKERIEWMQKNRQPYFTKDVYPWTVVESQEVYYAMRFNGDCVMGGEFLKYDSYDVK